jgi:glycerol uptake facilitator-like aquaporin
MPTEDMERARVRVERAAEQQRADEAQRTEGSAKRAAVMRTMKLQRHTGLRRFLFENGLVLAAFALFVVSFGGQIMTGHSVYNEEQRQHLQPSVGLGDYLRTGAFVEATAENWESEFLQMGVFVLLTVFLYQRGSSESKTIEEPDPVDQRPEEARGDPEAPGPVRRGGLSLLLYKHSLSISLFALFIISFLLHAAGGAREYSEDQQQHGAGPVSMFGYLATSQFWFESFQNWQSEFLSVAVLVLLSIWLREQGSAQSKPVAAPHVDTSE